MALSDRGSDNTGMFHSLLRLIPNNLSDLNMRSSICDNGYVNIAVACVVRRLDQDCGGVEIGMIRTARQKQPRADRNHSHGAENQ